MKKVLVLALIMALGFAAIAQKAVVKGVLTGFGEGAKLIVNQAEGNQLKAIDTVEIATNGEYKITVTPKEATLYILTFNREQSPVLHVMLEEDDHVTLNSEYLASYNFARVTESKGSENVIAYMKFNNAMMQANTAGKVADIVREHKNCVMSAFLVTYFDQAFDDNYQLYVIVRDALKGKYGDNNFVRYINDRVEHTIFPGKEAPEIAMLDVDGKTRKLSDLRGKVVLLDFWASWCTPCRRENPHVVEIYHKYKDQGFDIYSVSLDKNREAWIKAIKDDGLVWENHVSDLLGWVSSGGKTYGIQSVPSTVLIDREGKVIARNLRGQALDDAIRDALEKK